MSSRPPKSGKSSVPSPKREKRARQPSSNPNLPAQTRKVLLKHYRTKYGVRHRGGGR